jgi:large subunit ribosomal protein L21
MFKNVKEYVDLFQKFMHNGESAPASAGIPPEVLSATDAGNLSTMKVTELKALAKEKGLKGYTGLRKAELIEMLQQN